jgi:hypothetical protein
MINTSEQLGGALGIAILEAIELGVKLQQAAGPLRRTRHPPDPPSERSRDRLPRNRLRGDLYASAGIALVGAFFSLILVRKRDRVKAAGVFTRRSRWIFATSGRSPAITRRPAPKPGESATG